MNDGVLRKRIDLSRYVTEQVGLPTLNDILVELAKPGRDPRAGFEIFRFTEGIEKLEDLEPGMKLPGIVTNITAFGAFVDIGVHQDGLVHLSQIADRFVKDPGDVLKVHQQVEVTVLARGPGAQKDLPFLEEEPGCSRRDSGWRGPGRQKSRGGREKAGIGGRPDRDRGIPGRTGRLRARRSG